MRFLLCAVYIFISLLTIGQQEVHISPYKFKSIDSLNLTKNSIRVKLIISQNLKKVKNRKIDYEKFYLTNDSSAFVLDSAWLEVHAYNTKDSTLYISNRIKGRIFSKKSGASIKFKNVPIKATLDNKINLVKYLLYIEGMTSFYSDNQIYGADLFDSFSSELIFGKIDEEKRIAKLQYSKNSGFFISNLK
tara:strand:- start:479 stop:1048 length:570 start_codon:yes stop_codon:yes gene_type:complete